MRVIHECVLYTNKYGTWNSKIACSNYTQKAHAYLFLWSLVPHKKKTSLYFHSIPLELDPLIGRQHPLTIIAFTLKKHMHLWTLVPRAHKSSWYFHSIALDHSRSHISICIFIVFGCLFTCIYSCSLSCIPKPFPYHLLLYSFILSSIIFHISVILHFKHRHSFFTNISKPYQIHQLPQTKLLICMLASCPPSRLILIDNMTDNRVLNYQPPLINDEETYLTRRQLATLSQLRSSHCKLLNSYKKTLKQTDSSSGMEDATTDLYYILSGMLFQYQISCSLHKLS